MAVDIDEEIIDTFIVPTNYTNKGKLFGMVRIRNAVEAGVVGYLLYLIFDAVLISQKFQTKIIIEACIIGPIALICCIGINGDCLSEFLRSVINFLKSKRKLRFKRIKRYVD